jgi:kynureninase
VRYRFDALEARHFDEAEELAPFRSEFVIENPDLIYLDGNSLGRLPVRTARRLLEAVEAGWGARLIRGWNDDWFMAPHRVGEKIARLIGAAPDEVILTDSVSVNLFKLLVAALRAPSLSPSRRKVVTDDLNFPSDLYVLEGVLDLLGDGFRMEVVPSEDGMTVPAATLAAALDESTALLMLTHTAFRSGFMHDLPAVTARAKAAGALVLWDLSHSVGAVPIDLHAAGADFAVGCTYKYLNGGPGAPAFLYIRRELQESLNNPIQGWFGQRDPFDFAMEYRPARGIARFLAGTPPVLSMLAAECGIDLLLEAGTERLRAKSVRQSEYLIGLWKERLEPLGVELRSPRDPSCRGSHVSFGHPEGLRIDRALIEEMKVVPDFRFPDNIRFGIAPLYTTYAELLEAVQRLRRVLTDRLYERYSRDRPAVT